MVNIVQLTKMLIDPELISWAFWLVVFIASLQFMIVGGGIYVVWKIWMAVFELFRNADTERAKLLKEFLGIIHIEINKGGQKVRVVGVGLASTIAILLLCVITAWIIGSHEIGSS